MSETRNIWAEPDPERDGHLFVTFVNGESCFQANINLDEAIDLCEQLTEVGNKVLAAMKEQVNIGGPEPEREDMTGPEAFPDPPETEPKPEVQDNLGASPHEATMSVKLCPDGCCVWAKITPQGMDDESRSIFMVPSTARILGEFMVRCANKADLHDENLGERRH